MSAKCPDCPHAIRQHELDGDGHCRGKIFTNWDEATRRFLGSRNCECRGRHVGKDDCDCEYVSTSPNCVHCGKVRV